MENLHAHIDYTLLRPGCTRTEIATLCETAIANRYAAVCVPPYYLTLARQHMAGSAVKLCSVVGFPHGMHLTDNKLQEAESLLQEGADELDMVINPCMVRDGLWHELAHEISSFVAICHEGGAMAKIILETGTLDENDIRKLCEICANAKADFAKTSTGYAAKGAEIETVALMRSVLPPSVKIKASGGIRTAEQAAAFIAAGADRIGTSATL